MRAYLHIISIFIVSAIFICLSVLSAEHSYGSDIRAEYEFEIQFYGTNFDVHPQTGEKTASLEPEEKEVFLVKVTNMGSEPDNYMLSLSNIDLDWEVVFSTGEPTTILSIGSGQVETEEVWVIGHVEGTANLTVICKSSSTGIEKYDTIVLTVARPLIELYCINEYIHYVDAGESTIYKLQIINNQYFGCEVTLNIEGTVTLCNATDINNWTAWFFNNPVYVGAENLTVTSLIVYAPVNSMAGQQLKFEVHASTETVVDADSITLTALVRARHNLTVSKYIWSQYGDPGETLLYNVTITNRGNTVEEVRPIIYQNVANWNIVISVEGEVVTYDEPFTIGALETKSVAITVQVPLDAHAGPYRIVLNFTARTDECTVTLETIVSQYFDIELDTIIDDGYIVDLAKSLEFPIMIKNVGNGLDTFKIELELNSEPGEPWGLTFSKITPPLLEPAEYYEEIYVDFNATIPITKPETAVYLPRVPDTAYSTLNITLDQNAEVYVVVNLTAPLTVLKSQYTLTVYCNSYKGGMTEITELRLKMRFGNVIFKGDYKLSPTAPVEGDTTTITVYIYNDYHLPAADINVYLYVDGKSVCKRDIEIIDKKQRLAVNLKWTATAGKHILNITMKGKACGLEVQPIIFELDVAEREAPTPTPITIGLLLAIIIVIVVIAIAAYAILRARRGRRRHQK